MNMVKGYGKPEQTIGKSLGVAKGEPAKNYPKTGSGKPLNWKNANSAGGKGVNRAK